MTKICPLVLSDWEGELSSEGCAKTERVAPEECSEEEGEGGRISPFVPPICLALDYVVGRAASCVQCLAVSQWFSERMVRQSVVQPQMPRHGFIGKRGSQNAERTTDIPSLS